MEMCFPIIVYLSNSDKYMVVKMRERLKYFIIIIVYYIILYYYLFREKERENQMRYKERFFIFHVYE